MKTVLQSGFDRPQEIIHLFIGGSELHGAKVGATDDLDIYGIFVCQPEEALGLVTRKHFVWSTATDDRRNGPEDIDLTLYSLHRWAQLAAKGNPTALHFLFADATSESTELWQMIQSQRNLFVSKQSAEQCLGFAGNQRRRITGEQGRGAKGMRPEYEGLYGYDTKAAMHCLRLYLECIELMRAGTITLPRPERECLIEVRSGQWTLEKFLEEANKLENEAKAAMQESLLQDTANIDAISKLIAKVHLIAWKSLQEIAG